MPSASHNGNWNADGRTLTKHGYVRVRVGIGHPLADSRGWCYEHELVWRAAGRDVPAGYEIHHRDEDKTHNRLSNLRLKLKADHARDHARGRRRAINGRFLSERRRA